MFQHRTQKETNLVLFQLGWLHMQDEEWVRGTACRVYSKHFLSILHTQQLTTFCMSIIHTWLFLYLWSHAHPLYTTPQKTLSKTYNYYILKWEYDTLSRCLITNESLWLSEFSVNTRFWFPLFLRNSIKNYIFFKCIAAKKYQFNTVHFLY